MLVLQLKRFEYSVYSRHKVTKKVDYQTSLDLAPFMSKPGGGSLVRAPLMVAAAHLQPYRLHLRCRESSIHRQLVARQLQLTTCRLPHRS